MVKDFGGGEAKQPKSRTDEFVLAAVVLGQAGAMSASVVLDSELVIGVVKIWTPNKPTVFVVERYLRLRAGQPVQHEQHSQARLHRRFCRGFGITHDTSQLGHPDTAGSGDAQSLQVSHAREARVQGHIHDYHALRDAQSDTEIADRAKERCDSKRAHVYDLTGGECGASNHDSTPP